LKTAFELGNEGESKMNFFGNPIWRGILIITLGAWLGACTSTPDTDPHEEEDLQDTEEAFSGISNDTDTAPWAPPRGSGPLDKAKSISPYASHQKPYTPQSSSNPLLGKPGTKNLAVDGVQLDKTAPKPKLKSKKKNKKYPRSGTTKSQTY
jgi:hypothetical protein